MTVKFKRTALCCAVGVLAFGFAAEADESIKFYESILNGEYAFCVEGYVPSGKKGENVNIMILNPGYDMNNSQKVLGNEYLQYQDSVVSGENGYFRIEVPIYLDGINDSGDYTCYVGGEAFSSTQTPEPVYFASIDDRKACIKMIKESESADAVYEKLSDIQKNLSVDGEVYDAIDKKAFANLIYQNRQALDTEDTAKSTKLLKSLMLTEAYNEGLSQFISNGTVFINTDILNFSEYDKDGVDLYKNGYEKILNEDGKKKVIAALMKKNFKNADELAKGFHQNVVLYGIKNHKDSGNGHVEALLTKENAKACGLNIPKYLALTSDSERSRAADEIMSKSFDTIAQLETVIENAAQNAKTNTGNAGNKGTGGGGGSYGSSKSDSQTVVVNGADNTPNDEIFSDLQNSEWAKEAIEYLYNNKIINGVGEKRFAPESYVTREQFAVMIMKAFEIEVDDSEAGFSDVAAGSWYEKYVNTAKKLGLVNGISSDMFGVGKNISRQDMAVMIKNAADFAKVSLESQKDVSFDDFDEISEYAKSAVKALSESGFINGFSNNTFRPKNNCTRAQAAKIIYELIKGVR